MSDDPTEGSAGTDLSAGFLVGGGRYTLLRPIAPGGMGVVWLAHDERLNEDVALKFLPPAIRDDAIELARLRQETQKSRKLTHPNIIRIYDLYEAPGEPAFISMEYIGGPNLWELMAGQPNGVLSWARLKPIVKQLCDALACAHAQRVIHRDIKPTNLMLAENDRLKLADFGLAAAAPQVDTDGFERHFQGGTLTHMSPQQLEGEAAAVTDDIYSLGATLYDLLSGRPPFYEGNIASQVLRDPPPPLQERLAALKMPNDVPPDVAAMIMACLAKDPSRRPRSALAVAEWIGAPSSSTVLLTPPAGPPEPGPIAPEPAEPARGNGRWVALIAVLACAGLAGWFLRPSPAPPTSLPPFTNAVVAALKPPPVVESRPSNLAPVKPIGPAIVSARNPTFLDMSFDPGLGPDGDINALALQPGGGILVAGDFDFFAGAPRHGLAALGHDGKLKGQDAAIDGTVNAIIELADGHILIAGGFNSVHGILRPRLARLESNLALDPLFYASQWPDGDIRTMVIDVNKIVITGPFMHVGRADCPGIARLDAGGHLDPYFEVGAGVNGQVLAAAALGGGNLLIGGIFSHYQSSARNYLSEVLNNGKPGTRFRRDVRGGAIRAITVERDGKVLLAGDFDAFHRARFKGVARLTGAGGLDRGFDPGGGPNGPVATMAEQGDGKVVIGGSFTSFNSVQRDGLARLNPDGSLDSAFAPKILGGDVRKVLVQPDGKILVAGRFTNVEGSARMKLARLNPVLSTE